MLEALYGFFYLAVATIMAPPFLAPSSKLVPVISPPDTPARCRSTGAGGSCPEIPSYDSGTTYFFSDGTTLSVRPLQRFKPPRRWEPLVPAADDRR